MNGAGAAGGGAGLAKPTPTNGLAAASGEDRGGSAAGCVSSSVPKKFLTIGMLRRKLMVLPRVLVQQVLLGTTECRVHSPRVAGERRLTAVIQRCCLARTSAVSSTAETLYDGARRRQLRTRTFF